MAFSLFPKPTRFYDLLKEQNRRMVAGVALLQELFADFPSARAKSHRIREIQAEGDGVSREISRQLSLTFLTPIDREDIRDVNAAQEGVLDAARVISTRMILYGFAHVTETAKAVAAALGDMAERAGSMLSLIIEHKDLQGLGSEVRELRRGAENLLESGLAQLYETRGGERDGLFDVIRWTQVYDRLGQAMHRIAELADTLEQMSLKYA